MSFLNVERLHKRYGANPVFSEIDFSASRGELVTLLGPSGCGKSTLLRCLAGLTPIDGGRIMLDGEEISNAAPQRRGIAMVFQSYALFPNMTVRDNVAFGLRMQRTRKDELERRVTEVLALVELDGLEARYPHQLSGGQRQRVALARSLVVRPRLLLLDEPLSALDARIRRHLREQIRRIQRELELTMVFVTHDQEEALSLSDRIVLMREGKIVQNGSAETLYTAPKDAFVAGFIGHYNLLDADVAGRLLDRSFSSRVAIRPESIQLDAGQGIAGEIVDHSLLGNVIRYRVKARGVELSVDVLNRSASSLLAPGSQVRLAIAEESIREVA
ncbi:ABC transporter ATP-binding protein [Halotalea alkalilenta]|uniref:Spermidine/putrescine ABC transporter ATP-binding protein n=1 Tax=Halotalea alkalilenta TaxID=376489 RepID=A0A172YAF9_9GAMM|nr:ABC transporter ATP-binding protein [Halotalea alkalilenta]ANF56194.1 spermidine/putrescine ABC transporter ATP-binding protein [Halotalea alkalilenta]